MLMYPLTQEQIEEYKLPKYLLNAIQSPISQIGNYRVLNPENWKELAVAAHRHIKELGCATDCEVSKNLFYASKNHRIKSTLIKLINIAKFNSSLLEASSDTLDRAKIIFDAHKFELEFKVV